MLTDEKFCDSAMKFALLKDTDNHFYTFEEYRTLIESNQTDKDGNVVYIYATNPTDQFTYIKDATDKGYNVLLMDGQLDSHFIGLLESKLTKARFVRVDSDVVENLIPKADRKNVEMDSNEREMLTELYRTQLPNVDKAEFVVSFEALNPDANPILITQNEYMRRMKDMAAMQPGMSFYGELPDSYNLIVNTESPIIKKITESANSNLKPMLENVFAAIDNANSKASELRDKTKNGSDKLSDDEQKQLSQFEQDITQQRAEEKKIIEEFGGNQPLVRQVIDLALLANGLLKGEALNAFIRRSVTLL